MYDYEIFRSNYKNNLKRHIQIKIFSAPLHNMLLRKQKKGISYAVLLQTKNVSATNVTFKVSCPGGIR